MKKYLFAYVCSSDMSSPNEAVEIRREDVLKVVEELDKIKEKKEQVSIDLLLNSVGGDIYSAFKIIKLLRNKCNELNVIVPEFANSAASLMSLGGNNIIMGPQSELGPLDKPLENPLLEGKGQFSALDGALPFSGLFEAAKNMAFDLAETFRTAWSLGRRESIELGFKISTNYIDATVKKMDSFILNMCTRWLKVPEKYGTELLEDYMFKAELSKINPQIKKIINEKIEKIVSELVWNYPEHSFAICRREAEKLGLKVINSEDFKNWNGLWDLYKILSKRTEKTIALMDKNSINEILGEQESSYQN